MANNSGFKAIKKFKQKFQNKNFSLQKNASNNRMMNETTKFVKII